MPAVPTSLPDREALRRRIRGLYAITPDCSDDADLLALSTAVLEGGTRILQYRSKQGDALSRVRQAQSLRALTRTHRALLIINDDPLLAAMVGADGVHLGHEDAHPAEVLAQYPQLLVGVSCYADLDRACEACASGADYLAFGAVAASPTKPAAGRAPLALFAAAAPLELPLVAIGGITLENAAAIHAAGADALAVISALFEDHDPRTKAQAFVQLLSERTPR